MSGSGKFVLSKIKTQSGLGDFDDDIQGRVGTPGLMAQKYLSRPQADIALMRKNQTVVSYFVKSTLAVSLKNIFDSQKEEYPHYIKDRVQECDRAYVAVSAQLLSLNPKKIKLYLTNSQSIFFRVLTTDNYDVRYEVFYGLDELKVVTSVYKEKNLVCRDSGTIEEVFNCVKDVIHTPFKGIHSSKERDYTGSGSIASKEFYCA